MGDWPAFKVPYVIFSPGAGQNVVGGMANTSLYLSVIESFNRKVLAKLAGQSRVRLATSRGCASNSTRPRPSSGRPSTSSALLRPRLNRGARRPPPRVSDLQDCDVCCRPWRVLVRRRSDG